MTESDSFQDPLFKGCTRPPMLADVPLIPMVVVTGIFLLLAMYAFILISPFSALGILVPYAPIYLWMRVLTKRDDQRLNQMMLRMRMRLRMRAARAHWGAATYSPLRFTKVGKP